MQVKDLIEKLEALDPELDIYCYTEDEELLKNGSGIRVMFIENLSVVQAKTYRDGQHDPTISFEGGSGSKKLALAHVTCNF